MLWKSIHPDLDIPTNKTTWEWAFEDPLYSPLARGTDVGCYLNTSTLERLPFTTVKSHATALHKALSSRYGFGPGQTVSLFSPTSVWYPVVMWAVVRAGGRINGASPAYTAEEMAHALRTADTKIMVTAPECLEVALEAARQVGLAQDRVLLLETTAKTEFTSVQSLVREIEADADGDITPFYRIPPGKTNRDICGYLNFSSGTTGFPKAVMLSHHNVIAQCHQLRQMQLLPSDGGRYRILAVMPLFHITGLVRFCTYPLLMNGDSLMMPRFEMEDMLIQIIRYRVEELILVPPLIVRMVRDPVVDRYLPQLRAVVKRWGSGSAPISHEIIALLKARFPDSGFRQGYGATESTACISQHPPTHLDFRYASTGGLLVANTVAKVISLEDPRKILRAGETGEICAKGPQIAMGYLGDEAATRQSFDEDGFLHTGDVGHIDEEGLIHIEDRIKEMIKVKGLQVPPAELEAVLMGHVNVEDCAVVGIEDDYAGERPKAFVVPRKDMASSRLGHELLNLVKQSKVRYKWLIEIEFVEGLPKSPTGKLLRRVLKAVNHKQESRRGFRVQEEGRERAKL
ncbi:4-coumarate-CoA ligase [Xylariaceae sp. FL0016]|nr:4-coumarate-CoA ligase [Xylariaceae sp. FL0016]